MGEIVEYLDLVEPFFLNFYYKFNENDIRKTIKHLEANKVAGSDYIPSACIMSTH